MSPFHWFFNSFNKDKFYYGSVNFLVNQSIYQTMFSQEKCLSTYQDLCKSFTVINGGKGGIPMFCAGSTLGRAQVPSYCDEKGLRHTLPREYPKYCHGESGYNSLRQPWLIQIFKDIESIALNFVYYWTNE